MLYYSCLHEKLTSYQLSASSWFDIGTTSIFSLAMLHIISPLPMINGLSINFYNHLGGNENIVTKVNLF